MQPCTNQASLLKPQPSGEARRDATGESEETLSVASWDASVLLCLFFSTFVRKHAPPHPLPDMRKMIRVENMNLLFDNLAP